VRRKEEKKEEKEKEKEKEKEVAMTYERPSRLAAKRSKEPKDRARQLIKI
jgi:hypothetical protein